MSRALLGSLLVLLIATPAWAQSVQYNRDTVGTSSDKLNMVGCIRRDTAGATVSAENDRAPCMVDANGMLWVTLGTQVQTFTNDPCSGAKTSAPFSFATATTTRLATESASNKVYICSINIVSVTAQGVAMVEGTGSTCTTPTGMAGGTTATTGWRLAAGVGFTFGNGTGSVLQTVGVNKSVCLINETANQVSGSIQYVVAP